GETGSSGELAATDRDLDSPRCERSLRAAGRRDGVLSGQVPTAADTSPRLGLPHPGRDAAATEGRHGLRVSVVPREGGHRSRRGGTAGMGGPNPRYAGQPSHGAAPTRLAWATPAAVFRRPPPPAATRTVRCTIRQRGGRAVVRVV